jgi:two-component system, LytTR family, response regulator
MIKTIVVDDEARSRQTIAELLQKYCPEVEVSGLAESGDDAFNLILKENPPLVFLDIEMPYEDGFDFLRRFESIPFEVIFITAFNQYAIQAIRTCALDYLLKPLSINDLKNAVDRAKLRINDRQSSGRYELLMQNISSKNTDGHHKLAIPTREGFEFLDIKNIIALEADGGYTNIRLSDGKKAVSTRNLKEYEEILPQTIFFRPHHSYLINLNHIRNYHKGEGGYVIMNDLTSIDISKRREKEFLERSGL